MAFLDGRGCGGRLTALFGGFRPGQSSALQLRELYNSSRAREEEKSLVGALRKVRSTGPATGTCATSPRVLTENPYESPELSPRFGPTL
jgi:hypothetical protein